MYKKYPGLLPVSGSPLACFNFEKARTEFIRRDDPLIPIKKKHDNLPDVHNAVIENQSQLPPVKKACKELDSLNLASVNRAWNCVHEARAFLAGIGHAGIEMGCWVFDSELHSGTNGKHYTLGDESSNIQIMDSLIDLGIGKITLYAEMDNYFAVDKRKAIFSKLALLIPELDPENPEMPTKFKRRGCNIELVNKLEQLSHGVTPAVWFSSRSHLSLSENNDRPNTISVKCYRFRKQLESFCTDIMYGSGGLSANQKNVVPLLLPTHTNIAKPHGEFKKNDLSSRPSAVSRLITMGERNQAHIAVVYGVHHKLSASATTLENWLEALTVQYRNENANKPAPDHPLIIAVFINTRDHISNTLRHLEKHLSVKRINMVTATAGPGKPPVETSSENAVEILASLRAGDIVIAEMPSLPKEEFERLINCSDYPALTEGANLTTDLLQAGHSYLSVVPFGNTPVPQDIGFPYGAITVQATSYKLRHTSEHSEILGVLKELAQAEKYQEVLNRIVLRCLNDGLGNLSKDYLEHFGFLESLEASKMSPRNDAPVTVVNLLEKAIARQKEGKKLGCFGRQTLLNALSPKVEALPYFIRECRNPDSAMTWHFKLMQHHINQSFNNAVAMACVRFARFKGIRPPYTRPDNKLAESVLDQNKDTHFQERD